MKKLLFLLSAALLMVACQSTEEQLKQRAAELCRFIPDHELLERSADYMTGDFYAVLDTMFYRLPEHEAMDHEWLYYFVTGNGGTIADFEVEKVEQIDDTHAIATILVRQKWEDGSFDPDADIEHHQLLMEKVNGEWLMADFDDHKADCIRYIQNNRREQALRDAVSVYLVREIGSQYSKGDLCVPSLMMVKEEPVNGSEDGGLMAVYGDFWIFWYNIVGDTLQTVSGGNHSGRMTLEMQGDKPVVTAFEQTEDGARFEASARRIFADENFYEMFMALRSNERVREAVRRSQLSDYVRRYEIPVRYYQDYGWPAVELE
jgi:hypothetical protein